MECTRSVGVVGLAEGEEALRPQVRPQCLGAGVVGRQHHELTHRGREAHEGVVDRLARAVVVEVIGVHVRDERDGGVVQHERAVGFVGLDDEELPAPRCELVPSDSMTPPLTKLGSAPSSMSAVMIMPVEVVLPCAPA